MVPTIFWKEKISIPVFKHSHVSSSAVKSFLCLFGIREVLLCWSTSAWLSSGFVVWIVLHAKDTIHVMYIFLNSFNVFLNIEQHSSNACSLDYKTKRF